MVLNNFFTAVWAIMMMTEQDETDSEAYYWEFIDDRCEMGRKFFDEFGLGKF